VSNPASHGLGPEERKKYEQLIAGLGTPAAPAPQQGQPQQPAPPQGHGQPALQGQPQPQMPQAPQQPAAGAQPYAQPQAPEQPPAPYEAQQPAPAPQEFFPGQQAEQPLAPETQQSFPATAPQQPAPAPQEFFPGQQAEQPLAPETQQSFPATAPQQPAPAPAPPQEPLTVPGPQAPAAEPQPDASAPAGDPFAQPAADPFSPPAFGQQQQAPAAPAEPVAEQQPADAGEPPSGTDPFQITGGPAQPVPPAPEQQPAQAPPFAQPETSQAQPGLFSGLASQPAEEQPSGEAPFAAPDVPQPQEPPAPAEPAFVQQEEQQVPEPAAAPGSDEGPLAGFEAEDVLYAIAIRDAETSARHSESRVLEMVHQEASISEQPKRRKRRPVKLEHSLPLDRITPGTPVVATFYSPSGGTGKTSQAMNTGALIAAVAQKIADKRRKAGQENVRVPRVLLLDGDLAHGSLDIRLKGRSGPSIHTLLLYLDQREDAGFKGEAAYPRYYDNAPPGEKAMRDFVIWNNALPNLNVLAAPDRPDKFHDFGPLELRNILRLLGQHYDVIIIDAGTDVVLETQRAWLQAANMVFMVTSPDIDRLFNAAQTARYMARAQRHPADFSENPQTLPPLVTREKLSVVVTRADADAGFDIDDVVLNKLFPWLEKRQYFRIPDLSAEMLRANNQSEFLVLQNQEYAKEIMKIAQLLFARYLSASQRNALPDASDS